jgi:hypothetical protein
MIQEFPFDKVLNGVGVVATLTSIFLAIKNHKDQTRIQALEH